jgi:pyruvate dehydrogenase E1 component alpha subunit
VTQGEAAAARSFSDPYFSGTNEEKASGLFTALDPNGRLKASFRDYFSENLARRLLQGMVSIRVIDRRMLNLQRQGRISFYGEASGQEAAVVGCAAAMRSDDWLVPALREAGAGLYRGLGLDQYIAQIYGNANDRTKGRQMPCHPCDPANNYVVMSSCVSTQIPHAVGIAMAIKLENTSDKVCVGFMGDGGTSEGDFHTAMNFAGVMKAPVVLVCQNNQWAISTPGASQCAADTLATKGEGYGIEALRVDGNDVFAVHEAMAYACAKARRGEGPTFLELFTYRVSAHSTSDDPSRYRDESITQEWQSNRDPIARAFAAGRAENWFGEGMVEELSQTVEAEVSQAIAAQDKAPLPALATLFEDVYERPDWRLEEQRAALQAEKQV